MKIALIGGGFDSIPSKKFGAIEMIIWNYKRDLEAAGHEVVIFNSQDLMRVAADINAGGFDFVELNYSEYVSFFSRHLTVPFCTVCHSGYITNRKKWSIGYYSVFYDMMKSSGIITLSEDIRQLYLDNGYKGFVRVVRNGIDVENFTMREKGNDRAVCLGRIQARKRQAWLARLISHTVDIDFIGPLHDDEFKAEGRARYCGFWMKNEVYENLSKYSCLVLLSDGEAAPLVVPEALAAGLSIVVSQSASANLDGSLPFVSILPDDIFDSELLAETINTQVRNNALYRPKIIEYAKSYFDNKVVVDDFIEIAEEFRNSGSEERVRYSIPFAKLPIYLVSKFALFIKFSLRSFRRSLGKPNQTAL